jgi:hypothetical protein
MINIIMAVHLKKFKTPLKKTRFEVLIARFSVMYRIVVHRQPDVSEEHIASILSSACSLLAGFSLGLLLGRGDAGVMFLRNVGLSPNYTAWQPKRPLQNSIFAKHTTLAGT